MATSKRKLQLNRETLRELNVDSMREVAGATYPDTECPNDTYSQGCHTYAGCTTLGGSCPKRFTASDLVC
jgi:hypothetical protein